MRRQIKLIVTNLCFSIALLSFYSLQAEQYLNLTDSVLTGIPLPNGTDSSKTAKTAKVEKAEASLIGRWENPYFSMESNANGQDTNARSLKYHFRQDGTYSKILGGAETQIEENGSWEISADGLQILMRSNSVCDGQPVIHTATIKHISFSELVLEQTMCISGINVTSEPQEFFFNKF